MLHQLLGEEKDVKYLDLIKKEQSDLKNLMKRIAAASSQGEALLDQLARNDPSFHLTDLTLPPGEVAARKAIGNFKEKELLKQKGNDFELTLLLSQAEALNYGWHLAEVATKTETQPERRRALDGIQRDMENLYYKVAAMLLSQERAPARP